MNPQYDDSNVFAKILLGDIPCHKVYEDDKTLAFMDVMPQAHGHVLIIPKYPAIELIDLPLDYAQAVFAAAQKIIPAQRKVLNTQGIVQMQLNHQQAGQSVFHYHMHLITTHLHHLGEHASIPSDHDTLAKLAAQLRDTLEQV